MIKLKATQSENGQIQQNFPKKHEQSRKNISNCQTVLDKNPSLQNKQNSNYLNLSYKL